MEALKFIRKHKKEYNGFIDYELKDKHNKTYLDYLAFVNSEKYYYEVNKRCFECNKKCLNKTLHFLFITSFNEINKCDCGLKCCFVDRDMIDMCIAIKMKNYSKLIYLMINYDNDEINIVMNFRKLLKKYPIIKEEILSRILNKQYLDDYFINLDLFIVKSCSIFYPDSIVKINTICNRQIKYHTLIKMKNYDKEALKDTFGKYMFNYSSKGDYEYLIYCIRGFYKIFKYFYSNYEICKFIINSCSMSEENENHFYNSIERVVQELCKMSEKCVLDNYYNWWIEKYAFKFSVKYRDEFKKVMLIKDIGDLIEKYGIKEIRKVLNDD